jgi:hypothetical protein
VRHCPVQDLSDRPTPPCKLCAIRPNRPCASYCHCLHALPIHLEKQQQVDVDVGASGCPTRDAFEGGVDAVAEEVAADSSMPLNTEGGKVVGNEAKGDMQGSVIATACMPYLP